MILSDRLSLLAELGDYLRTQSDDPELEAVIHRSYLENPWFTPENTRAALSAIANTMLDATLLQAWAAQYPIGNHPHPTKSIGLVMAGNIPIVGFQDWLCVFVAGQRAMIKLSEKDKLLLPFLIKKMGEWAHESREYTYFLTEHERLRDFDAVIATGSNNTARYFEQYFSKYPHIIRHNRNSIALIDGTETMADYFALGRDIFAYFGKGCRNVSKLYVPRGYDFNPLLEALHEYREMANHDKYKNNFDYNMTLYLLNLMPYLNNGCVILRENTALPSRVACVHYEYYDDRQSVLKDIELLSNEIQCIVGLPAWSAIQPFSMQVLPFGKSQEPGLGDYPDGVDVLAFLIK